MGVVGFLALFGLLAYVLVQVVGGTAGIIYFTGRFFTRKKREHKEQVEAIETAYRRLNGKAVRIKADLHFDLEPDQEWTVYHVTGMNDEHTALTTEEGVELHGPSNFEVVIEAKTR